MSEGLSPRPPESHEVSEALIEERRRVLDLAGKFHQVAHRADGAVAGDTNELYVVTDDYDIPFLSEKIRIVPLNTRVAPISEAFLYLPYDTDFQGVGDETDDYGHKIVPSTLFFKTRYRDGTVKQAIISELTVWMFAPGHQMELDADRLPLKEEELNIPAAFPEGQDLPALEEQEFLQEIQQLLRDRSRYRLGRQERPDAA